MTGGTRPMCRKRSIRYAAISRRGFDCGQICTGLNAARPPEAKSSRIDSELPPLLSRVPTTGASRNGAKSVSSSAGNTVHVDVDGDGDGDGDGSTGTGASGF